METEVYWSISAAAPGNLCTLSDQHANSGQNFTPMCLIRAYLYIKRDATHVLQHINMVLSHLTPGTDYADTGKVVWIFWPTSKQSARRWRGFLDGVAHIKQNVSDKKSNILRCWARGGNFSARPLWQTTAVSPVFALDSGLLRSIRVGRLNLSFKYGRAQHCLVMLNRCAKFLFFSSWQLHNRKKKEKRKENERRRN